MYVMREALWGSGICTLKRKLQDMVKKTLAKPDEEIKATLREENSLHS
jgi:hypothetical protein